MYIVWAAYEFSLMQLVRKIVNPQVPYMKILLIPAIGIAVSFSVACMPAVLGFRALA